MCQTPLLCGFLRQILQRIDRNAVEAHFKVQMRAGGETAGAGGARQTATAANGLALLNNLAFHDIYAAQMAVHGG